MCRLFGFRSVINSQVHSSLVHAENALRQQSEAHPDGWGVAYYVGESPHVIKSIETAIEDQLFQRVSGVVASHTVLAHIRRATEGNITTINTHPFQYGKWVFAHNGHIKDFPKHRQKVLDLIDVGLRRFILGETDSEHVFFVILSKLLSYGDIISDQFRVDDLEQAVKDAMGDLCAIIGPLQTKDDGPKDDNYLTFLLTNGPSMVAYQGGKTLYYSTYKSKCSERDTCPYFADFCEAESTTGKINHLVFSSEPLKGENVWIPMPFGQVVGVDIEMRLTVKESFGKV